MHDAPAIYFDCGKTHKFFKGITWCESRRDRPVFSRTICYAAKVISIAAPGPQMTHWRYIRDAAHASPKFVAWAGPLKRYG